MKVIYALTITLIIALTLACNPTTEPTAEPMPTLVPEATPSPSPTASATPEATATRTVPPTPDPVRTPTPAKSKNLPIKPSKNAPFVPNHYRSDTFEEVFVLLILSEQQCVQDIVGKDPLTLPFMRKEIRRYDPYNQAEEKFLNAMIYSCPSEAGHRERSYNDEWVSSNRKIGMYPTAEENACVRNLYDKVAIADDGDLEFGERGESAIIGCALDSLLVWWVRMFGAELERVTPNSLNPVVENCLMELAFELELPVHFENFNTVNDDPSDDSVDMEAEVAFDKFREQGPRCVE